MTGVLIAFMAIVLISKGWFQWKYLKEVAPQEHRSLLNSVIKKIYKRIRINRNPMDLPGYDYTNSGLSLTTILAVFLFFRNKTAKHSDRAKVYVKVIYGHLIAFYVALVMLFVQYF